jgi:hypothetical protein
MKPKSLDLNGGSDGAPKSLASLDSIFFLELQNLVNHCAVTRYDSGNARQPGWIVIKTVGTIWSVSVKDPDSCLQVGSVGITLDEALATANLLVAADNGPWELDRYLERRPGRPKGKKS